MSHMSSYKRSVEKALHHPIVIFPNTVNFRKLYLCLFRNHQYKPLNNL